MLDVKVRYAISHVPCIKCECTGLNILEGDEYLIAMLFDIQEDGVQFLKMFRLKTYVTHEDIMRLVLDYQRPFFRS